MSDPLRRRLRQMRSRVLVRSWDYRQRRHARGAWYRLRRVLAGTAEVYALPGEEARRLVGEGWRPEPVGKELQPARLLVSVSSERVARVADARPLEVRLTVELLSAEALALVPFGAAPAPGEPGS